MAKNKGTLYLGYEDEPITDKHDYLLNYTVNKIGGTPDWCNSEILIPNCPICNLNRPLILQIYAPLDNSKFHRTLYIFGCINSICSIKSSNWVCIRVQCLDDKIPDDNIKMMTTSKSSSSSSAAALGLATSVPLSPSSSSSLSATTNKKTKMMTAIPMNIAWCQESDNWDDDNDGDDDDDNVNDVVMDGNHNNEENGNNIMKDDNYYCNNKKKISHGDNNGGGGDDVDVDDDDEDESNSMDNDIIYSFDHLSVDDKNANCEAQGEGAIGCQYITGNNVYAEIENDESSELITIETPIMPDNDLNALLYKQNLGITKPLNKNIKLKSFFIYVEKEDKLSSTLLSSSSYINNQNNKISDHVRDLIQEYQMNDEIFKITTTTTTNTNVNAIGMANSSNTANLGDGKISKIGNDFEHELYEKSIPHHGDIMFHNFLTRIQMNPGQIVRYSRDTYPLLIGPLHEPLPKCQYCGSECICEIQILPTLITKLKFHDNNDDLVPIEYGNILIYTCIKSCWDTPDKMRLEHVIVQQEK